MTFRVERGERGELDRLYPQYPSGDPKYPDPPAPRPVFPPLVLVEEPGRVFPFAAEMAALGISIMAPTSVSWLKA